MSFAARDFAGTSECQARDGTLITVSSFFEGSERVVVHQACDMRRAIWCPDCAAFKVEGDARIYHPIEALPLLTLMS